MKTLKTHCLYIINYFNDRGTNTSAESLNAKVKYFR
ncbi:hypothetical protein [Myroides phaeus]